MKQQEPVLSDPSSAPVLDLGSTRVAHRIRSEDTNGALAVVEFHAAPGEGVGLHVHKREDELVYLLEGTIEVTVGDRSMTVSRGACALLPRGIPRGFTNTGDGPARQLAVLLPGKLDGFFVDLDRELSSEGPHDDAIARLCRRYRLRFVDSVPN